MNAATRILIGCTLLIRAPFIPVAGATANDASDHREAVVLLHGMGRTAASMMKMEMALVRSGFEVCNISYPSLDHSIEQLANEHVRPAIDGCFGAGRDVHFVTHSLGGILVRQLAASDARVRIGRVVMLSPPNRGSTLADRFNQWRVFETMGVAAGQHLGAAGETSPLHLGPATFDLGVITGNQSVNPFLSMLIEGDDDGKVGVEEAKLEGMRDFLVVRASHTFIMRDAEVIEQTIAFLRTGAFATASSPASHSQ